MHSGNIVSATEKCTYNENLGASIFDHNLKKKKTCSALSMLLGTRADAQQMAIIFRGVDAYIWLHREPAGIIYVPSLCGICSICKRSLPCLPSFPL